MASCSMRRGTEVLMVQRRDIPVWVSPQGGATRRGAGRGDALSSLEVKLGTRQRLSEKLWSISLVTNDEVFTSF